MATPDLPTVKRISVATSITSNYSSPSTVSPTDVRTSRYSTRSTISPTNDPSPVDPASFSFPAPPAAPYSTLEPIQHDPSTTSPQRVYLPPLPLVGPEPPIPRSDSTFTTSSTGTGFDVEKCTAGAGLDTDKYPAPLPPVPSRKRQLLSTISRRRFLISLLAFAVLALIAGGTALGLGLRGRAAATRASQAGDASSSSSNSSAPTGPAVPACTTAEVLFSVDAPTNWGENMFVSGVGPALGDWDLDRAVPLSSANYTQERPLWFGTVRVDAADGEGVGYEYVRKMGEGDAGWVREGRRRVLDLSKEGDVCDGKGMEVVDEWGGPAPGKGTKGRRARR